MRTYCRARRRSELRGQQWSDVEFDPPSLAVRRAGPWFGHPMVKEPKTAKSRRTVDLYDGTVTSLRERETLAPRRPHMARNVSLEA